MSYERVCGQNLNLVRLPIPPLPHITLRGGCCSDYLKEMRASVFDRASSDTPMKDEHIEKSPCAFHLPNKVCGITRDKLARSSAFVNAALTKRVVPSRISNIRCLCSPGSGSDVAPSHSTGTNQSSRVSCLPPKTLA